eukprot:196925-Prymnesium_polylepis.1
MLSRHDVDSLGDSPLSLYLEWVRVLAERIASALTSSQKVPGVGSLTRNHGTGEVDHAERLFRSLVRVVLEEPIAEHKPTMLPGRNDVPFLPEPACAS